MEFKEEIVVSIIVPAYNEESTIKQVLQTVSKVFTEHFSGDNSKYEIVVVNDCSTDNTLKEIQEFRSAAQLKIVSNEVNRGKGASMREGLKVAEGKYSLFQDGDMELECKELIELLRTLGEGVEFVNGTRFSSGNVENYPYSSFIANKVFAITASVLSGRKTTDLTCAYKGASTKLLKALPLKEDRFGFEADLFMKIMKEPGIKFKEVPISFFPRSVMQGKKIKKRDAFRILYVIVKNFF